jgi:hypothetical protein
MNDNNPNSPFWAWAAFADLGELNELMGFDRASLWLANESSINIDGDTCREISLALCKQIANERVAAARAEVSEAMQRDGMEFDPILFDLAWVGMQRASGVDVDAWKDALKLKWDWWDSWAGARGE